MEYIFLSICFLLLFFILSLSFKIDKVERRLKSTQLMLQQLAEHSGVAENPINDELRVLINEGEEIKAVKRAREALGLSLIEGKEYIDRLKATLK